jgi:hypothetical protein
MKSTCYRLTIALLAIFALSVPVFGQTGGDDAHRHLVRGMAAVEMAGSDEELGSAAEEFKKAIAIAPDMAAAWYNLGVVQARMGQVKEAIASYQRFLALDPIPEDAKWARDEIIKLEYRLEKTEKLQSLAGQWIDADRTVYNLYTEGNKLVLRGSHPRSRSDIAFSDIVLVNLGGIGGLGAEDLTIRLDQRGGKLVGAWDVPSGKINPSDVCTLPAETGEAEGAINDLNHRMTLRLMRAKYKVVQVDPIFFGDVVCQEVSVIETRPVEMTFFGPLPRGDIRFIKLNSSGTFTAENVGKGSPEEAAGLREGDEIIAIDGADVRQMATEGEKIMKRRGEPGSTVQLLMNRDKKTVTITLRRSEV